MEEEEGRAKKGTNHDQTATYCVLLLQAQTSVLIERASEREREREKGSFRLKWHWQANLPNLTEKAIIQDSFEKFVLINRL